MHWGVAPTWANLAIAIPVAMLAYTGVETVSNLAEEARDPSRSVPLAYKLVAGAVFAIYFTLPLVALSAMPVTRSTAAGDRARPCRRSRAATRTTRCSGSSTTSASTGSTLHVLQIYVGLLAATILFIATNAGVIGASRVTYSMATYRQIPEIFRRLHPTFKTPWLSLVIFAGIAPICVILPGSVTFVGTLYSFGATLSFTVAHASIVALRRKARTGTRTSSTARSRTCASAASTGRSSPSSAASRRASPSSSSSSRTRPRAGSALGWIATGFVGYAIYRRRYVHVSLTETVKAPPLLGPALALEYRMILSPVVDSPQSREALHLACRLAAERRSAIVAMRVLVVPMDLPLDAELPEQEKLADRLLDEAHDIGELVRRPRDRAGLPCAACGPRDRRGGRAPERGDHRHGRAEAAAPDAPERDLRQDGRLRAEERGVPRDGRRRSPGRGVKGTYGDRRRRLQLPVRRASASG